MGGEKLLTCVCMRRYWGVVGYADSVWMRRCWDVVGCADSVWMRWCWDVVGCADSVWMRRCWECNVVPMGWRTGGEALCLLGEIEKIFYFLLAVAGKLHV